MEVVFTFVDMCQDVTVISFRFERELRYRGTEV